jgi:hypothetical protein
MTNPAIENPVNASAPAPVAVPATAELVYILRFLPESLAGENVMAAATEGKDTRSPDEGRQDDQSGHGPE